MFDTMTLTKAVGSVCAALLILLLGGWAANGLFNVGGGHGEDHVAGYVIDTGEGDAAAQDVVEEVAFADILAAADPADGEGLFRQCRSCHVVDPGVNGVGPSLYGVVGRDIASVEGFGYSSALQGLEGGWTPEAMHRARRCPTAGCAASKTVPRWSPISIRLMNDLAQRASLAALPGGLLRLGDHEDLIRLEPGRR